MRNNSAKRKETVEQVQGYIDRIYYEGKVLGEKARKIPKAVG